MQLTLCNPNHQNGGLIFKPPTELCEPDTGSVGGLVVTLCNPVHANGGLIFKAPTEICIEEISRGGAGGGKVPRTEAPLQPRLDEEEELLVSGLTLILMELM